MKVLKVSKPFFVVLTTLIVAQFACLASAQSLNNMASQVSTQSPAPTTSSSESPTASNKKSDQGTAAEAQAMLQLAIQHIKTAGRTQALADFTAGKAPFKDRDLYVACIDSQLAQSANGGFPDLVGSRIQPLSRAAWDAASTSTVSSITYSYINPTTGKVEPKTFFYEKIGTDVCGVGAYNP